MNLIFAVLLIPMRLVGGWAAWRHAHQQRLSAFLCWPGRVRHRASRGGLRRLKPASEGR